MTPSLGDVALLGGAAASAWGVMSSATAAVRGVGLRHARAAVLLQPVMVGLAFFLLASAMLRSDFRFAYVAEHSERSLPVALKFAAVWAGQEGSLLLWAFVLSVVGALAAWSRRGIDRPGEAVTLGSFSVVNGFFAGLLFLAANPFLPGRFGAPLDGYGLNPMLQHWAMVLHPPMLFTGYACSIVPFAVAMGAIVGGRGSEGWSVEARRWALASWLFLTIGISLGAWWAYVELGWGGYWAWDPVENASLLPWLAGTALVHTIMVDSQRGGFRHWVAGLAVATFGLCVLATYMTRSGVVESIHAFAASSVGSAFLVLLAAVVLGGVTTLIAGRRSLRRGGGLERVVSRDGAVLVANVLLLSMTGVTLIGTIFPLISGLFMARAVGVGSAYYERVFGPLALGLLSIMALAPLLGYGSAGLGRGAIRLALGSACVVIAALAAGVHNVAVLACVAIASLTVLVGGASLLRVVRTSGTGLLETILANHRRIGGQVVHTGLVLVLVGVAGSSLYARKQSFTLEAGETAEFAGYSVKLERLGDLRGSNYSAVEAVVTLTDRRGGVVELRPQQRFYDKTESAAAEVDIRAGLGQDLYVGLLGWTAGGSSAAVQVLINPVVTWIWIGAAMMAGGGVLCLVPRVLPSVRAQEAAEPAVQGADLPVASGRAAFP
ncbi:MAG: heme lyase CcmF/NrfE family subunit [Phycisphaerales bacterium]|nr:heme lyase CcmF/NrfE family subunit [Phycisphaerales bacterium]